ncbi:MAG: hypothetical protein CMJ32_01900 [Phycisphaerae bacterium]|nr:hypothetical protein [Phycisphaerae bacterium]
MRIWINGTFEQAESATITPFDAGFQHGVGLFETMLARGGSVFRMMDHLERLRESARELGLSERLRIDPLAEAIESTLLENDLSDARIRLTISGGNLNMLQSPGQKAVDPTIVIAVQPPTRYPDEMFTDGVTVLVAEGRLNPLDRFSGHKTLNYWFRLSELNRAAAAGAGESIFCSVSNHLAGGCVSNIFLVKGDTLQTPIARGEEPPGALQSPVLPGVTRKFILQAVQAMGMTSEVRMLDVSDLMSADEIFLVNSSWGVLPVCNVEAHVVGDGQVGHRTGEFRKSWLEAVAAGDE